MFIDYLTLIMINLVAGTALLAYYLYAGIDAEDQRPYAAGFGAVGLLGLILGLAVTLTWPLPGSYNIAFGEATTLFGVVFLATAVALSQRWSLVPVAIYAFFAGVYAILVGWRIISLEMTKQPLLSGLGFILAGLGGLFAAPALRWARTSRLFRLLAVAALVVTVLLWGVTFYNSLWGHLESFAQWLPPTMK